MNDMTQDTTATLFDSLNAFMPMHLLIDSDGRIRHIGPTLEKLRASEEMIGRNIADVFDVQDNGRGEKNGGPVPLKTKLYLSFSDGIATPLKGIAMPVFEGKGILLNLSFGISVVEAVSDYRLTAGDFAHTDLTIEMLYLVEAKAAVMAETKQLNDRLQGAKVAAEEQAYTDTLTGLKNRRAMDSVLERMTRVNAPFSLMQLDLDYFKSVNDTLGHAAGDTVLIHVAGVLTQEVRGDDMVVRIGGDEFILIFNKSINKDRLLRTARRIISRLEEPIPYQDTFCNISGSIGITTTEFYDVPSADEMIHDADLALYTSKGQGRAQATFFDPLIHVDQVTENNEDTVDP